MNAITGTDIDGGMDLEGRLRFHAQALQSAPSNDEVPGTPYAVDWQANEAGRVRTLESACTLIETAAGDPHIGKELSERMNAASASMRAAGNGRYVPDTFHLLNWEDKPHRLLYEAHDLMVEAADAIAAKTPPRT